MHYCLNTDHGLHYPDSVCIRSELYSSPKPTLLA